MNSTRRMFTMLPAAAAVSLILSTVYCGPSKADKELMEKAQKTFGILKDKKMEGSKYDTPAKVALGKKLYFEKRLSKNDSQSCNTCHMLDAGKAGVDNKPTSDGAFGDKGERNSPTVFNAGFHIAQFWDGRAKDLKEQAKGPILNPVEMAMPSEKAVIDKLKKLDNGAYVAEFKKAFPNAKKSLTYNKLANAIAAFERTLVTTDRFDKYLAGDHKALQDQEKKGLKLFMDTGCTTCHSGALLGGAMYMKMGLLKPYQNTKDLGRFNVTKNEGDKFVFKVPSLRNIANTGPYFHDGAEADLAGAVKTMASLQLNKDLKKEEVEAITAFLKALSYENPGITL